MALPELKAAAVFAVPAYHIVDAGRCEALFAKPSTLIRHLALPVTMHSWQTLHRGSFAQQLDASANPAWWMHHEADANTARALLFVPPELPCFRGHFPNRPILPGVLQLDWAVELADALWPKQTRADHFAGLARLKFKAPVEPGAMLAIRLTLAPGGATLKIESCDSDLTSARLLYRD